MKKKFNPKEWLQTNGPSSVPQPSNHVENQGPNSASTIQPSNPQPENPGPSNHPTIQPSSHQPSNHTTIQPSNVSSDVEVIITRIEAAHTDITANYSDWRDIGFALADEFGESGRDYYHRVSRFYPNYSSTDCNKQFDQCLKATPSSRGHGITLKTFFHLAKQSGIDIGCRETNVTNQVIPAGISSGASILSASAGPDSVDEPIEEETNLLFNTPQLPSEVYDNLPVILQESADLFLDSVEKDVFLIGSLAVLSGCLPNIEGIYFDDPNSAHLYTFITAPAGSGKGKMKWSKYFGQAIHTHLLTQSRLARNKYESEMEQYNNLTRPQKQGTEKPEEPPRRMFFIPANSSSSAFIQALSDNNFRGVLFETEADTLADTFKQEWGNFSDVLRKAFHHESTSMFRRKDNEFIEIHDPHIAIGLSGTPKQVHNMIPDVENGLFSRFLYYAFEDNSEFKNPFVSHRPINYTDFFNHKATVIFDLYQQLQRLPQKIVFQLTDAQGSKFTDIFNTMLTKNNLLLGRDFDANIKRLGLITFRIAMIISGLRILEDGDLSSPMICSDRDFETAMTIATTLEKHAIAVFQNLPNNDLKGIKLKFFEKLPQQFDRQGYLKVAEELGILPRTAEKYVGQFKPKLLNHEHNLYTKVG